MKIALNIYQSVPQSMRKRLQDENKKELIDRREVVGKFK